MSEGAGAEPTDRCDDWEAARQRRRLQEDARRRQRRAQAADRERPRLAVVAQLNQAPSVPELLWLSGPCGPPLTAAALRRLRTGLAEPAGRRAWTESADWQHRVQRVLLQLTGGEPDARLEAAGCVTNLAVDAASAQLTRMVGGYLVTQATGASRQLQRQCIWALGNLATSGADVCAQLAAQGLTGAAISCLESEHEDVREAAAAAVGAFLTYASAEDCSRLSPALVPRLVPLLAPDAPAAGLCLAAAAACPAAERLLGPAPDELVPAVLRPLLEAASDPAPSLRRLRALTQLLRALTHLALAPAAASALLCHPDAGRLLLLLLGHGQRHVRRESLLLAANLLESRSEEVRRAATVAGLRASLGPLLERAHVGLAAAAEREDA